MRRPTQIVPHLHTIAATTLGALLRCSATVQELSPAPAASSDATPTVNQVVAAEVERARRVLGTHASSG